VLKTMEDAFTRGSSFRKK